MPVQGKYVDASRLLWSDATSKPEKQHDAQHDQSSTHVKGMQANQRVVRCSKKIRGNSEAVLVNQAVPFLASAVQKECPKSNREYPEEQERAPSAAFQKFPRKVDRQAAGQQTDGVEDGRL